MPPVASALVVALASFVIGFLSHVALVAARIARLETRADRADTDRKESETWRSEMTRKVERTLELVVKLAAKSGVEVST